MAQQLRCGSSGPEKAKFSTYAMSIGIDCGELSEATEAKVTTWRKRPP